MTTGKLIKEKLRTNHIRQRELADITQVSEVAVCKWVADKVLPTSDKVVIICDTLDITPNEWFDALRESA